MNQPATKPAAPPKTAVPVEPSDPYLIDAPTWMGISRGIAGFFGALCVLEGFRALAIGQRTADFGWLDLSPCPPDLARGLIAFSGVCLVLFSLTHRLPQIVRLPAIIGTAVIFAVSTGNAISIHRSIQLGELADGIPMSAHVVTLLIPVLFGLARGPKFGPLRFPIGGSMLMLSFLLSAGAFSVGYLTSISKFHRPQPGGKIVVMHPRSDFADGSSPHAAAVQQLVANGYGNEIILLHETDSPVSPLSVETLSESLGDTVSVRAESVTSDAEIAAAINDKRDIVCQFVGDRRDAARMRLIGQRTAGRVSFVVATTSPMGRTVSQDVENLWSTWFAGFRDDAIPVSTATVSTGANSVRPPTAGVHAVSQ